MEIYTGVKALQIKENILTFKVCIKASHRLGFQICICANRLFPWSGTASLQTTHLASILFANGNLAEYNAPYRYTEPCTTRPGVPIPLAT